MRGEAVRMVPAYVPRHDPVWDATRPERGPIRWYVDYVIPAKDGHPATPMSLACYDEIERGHALERAQMDHGEGIQVLTYEEKNGRPAPQVRS